MAHLHRGGENDSGEVVKELVLGADNKTFERQRWSTPLRDHRSFGPFRLPSFGEARHHPASGEYAYGQFEMREITYNER